MAVQLNSNMWKRIYSSRIITPGNFPEPTEYQQDQTILSSPQGLKPEPSAMFETRCLGFLNAQDFLISEESTQDGGVIDITCRFNSREGPQLDRQPLQVAQGLCYRGNISR